MALCDEHSDQTPTAIDTATADEQPRSPFTLSVISPSSQTSWTDARPTCDYANNKDVAHFDGTEHYLSNAFRPKIAALVGEEDYRRFIEELEWQWEHDALTLVERNQDVRTTLSAAKRAIAVKSGLSSNRALVAVLRGIREEAEAFMTVRTLEEHERKVAILRRRNAARRDSNVVDRTHTDSIKDRLLETMKGTFKRADTGRNGWQAHGFYSFRGQHRTSGSSKHSLADVIAKAEAKVMHIMRDAEDLKDRIRSTVTNEVFNQTLHNTKNSLTSAKLRHPSQLHTMPIQEMENGSSESSKIRFVRTTSGSGCFTAIASIADRLSSFVLRTMESNAPGNIFAQAEFPVPNADDKKGDLPLGEDASLHSQEDVDTNLSESRCAHARSLSGTTLDASASAISILTSVHCTVCTQTTMTDEMLQLSCRGNSSKPHAYCATCLNAVFTCSIEGKTRFPPACCGKAIPHDLARYFLEENVKKQYWRKVAEQMLTKEEEAGTCSACRLPAHEGGCRTSGDDLTRLLLDTSARRGWRQCPRCKTMVERDCGCPRIRCLCGMSFCYDCGKPWEDCFGCDKGGNGPRYRNRRPAEVVESSDRREDISI